MLNLAKKYSLTCAHSALITSTITCNQTTYYGMENKITEIEKSIAALSDELKSLGESITTGFKKVDANFETVKKEIDFLHKKVDLLSTKVAALDTSTTDGFDDVGIKLENLTEEITKIGKVTGYDEEFKNLSGFKN